MWTKIQNEFGKDHGKMMWFTDDETKIETRKVKDVMGWGTDDRDPMMSFHLEGGFSVIFSGEENIKAILRCAQNALKEAAHGKKKR